MGNQLLSVAWPRFASLNSHNSPLCRHFGEEKRKAWQDRASCLKPQSVNSRFVAAISICLLPLEPELSLWGPSVWAEVRVKRKGPVDSIGPGQF